MGIAGLLLTDQVKSALRPIADFKQLQRELGGHVAGVDGHSWLHQRIHTVGDKLFLKECGYETLIQYFKSQIDLLLEAGIVPLIVFDGMDLPAKKETDRKRRQ